MIAVLQRAKEGAVTVEGIRVGKINLGLVILLGVFQDDSKADVEFLTEKIANFRIFNDDNCKMNLSIKDVEGSALVISQFTLCGDWRKGRRPSFIHAAPPQIGEYLYEEFITCLKSKDIPVESGKFGAMMEVKLVNDGPVTFVLDSRKR